MAKIHKPDGTYQPTPSLLPKAGAASGTARVEKQENGNPFQAEQLAREKREREEVYDRAARKQNDPASGV